MSHCCGNHPKTGKIKTSGCGGAAPKSFVGRLLYNVGKKECEKENNKKLDGKKDC